MMHWYNYALPAVKLLLLFLGPPLVMGFIIGLVSRDRGSRYAKVPGWAYYLLLEILVIFDKGFPFFWTNLLRMVLQNPLSFWIEVAAGIVIGVLCFFSCGRTSLDGYKLAGRTVGFDPAPTLQRSTSR